MESRPSSSSVAKSPVLISTSASASFNGHLLSISSSQRRLRALSKPDSDELPQHDKLKSPAVLESLPATPQSQSLPLYSLEKSSQPRSRSATALHWLLVAYCLLSAAFFTGHLFAIPGSLNTGNLRQDNRDVSPINDMPVPYRLSKLLQAEPRLDFFTPFVSSARLPYQSTAVTACVWIEAKDLSQLETWSSNWAGETSLSLRKA